ncbi:MAG: 30S ribosomal protein S12 methylthiotransferase RimO [Lentisphaerales bacterium]|nr:MAG: 30S ribosomal protein S12 methylthiotransferase RimO [Lentisphaerales bacterium]
MPDSDKSCRSKSDSTGLTVGFISLGCAKNLVDSEYMASTLLAEGLKLAPSPEDADVVLVNTCAFIDSAKEESIDAILEACALKEDGRCRSVVVAGCLPQRYGAGLCAELPEVDAFIGLDELDKIGTVIKQVISGESGIVRISPRSTALFEPPSDRILFSGGPCAYLKIAEGCSHGCAFCAIPAIRGPYRSRPVNGIVREAENLLENGVRELNLISQNSTLYGDDLDDGSDIAVLLRALASIGGEFWIRLLYGHPCHVSDELLSAIGELGQMCRYLDVPVQHSHPSVLKAMLREDDRYGGVAAMPARVRRGVPDIALRTTCLVGYPGETEAHFQHLLGYVIASEFDHLGVFTFSQQENTRAASLPNRPATETALERRERLMLAQQEIIARKGVKLLGKHDRILLERPASDGSGIWCGRSRRQAPDVDGQVAVAGVQEQLAPGGLVNVQYTSVSGYDMDAEATGADRAGHLPVSG